MVLIDAGQRTDWQRGGSLIQISAFCVIKRRRTFNIFSWAMYSQETFGSPSCRALVLQHLLLNLLTNPFDNWWRKVDSAASGDYRLGLNSLVILGAWSIWRHRNDCVFNGLTPNVNLALALAREEAHWWSLAGAKGISLLSAGGSV